MSLTLKVLNFWKFTSLKPLWSSMGEVVPGSYLTNPTSPIPSHCASVVATSTVRVNTFLITKESCYHFTGVENAGGTWRSSKRSPSGCTVHSVTTHTAYHRMGRSSCTENSSAPLMTSSLLCGQQGEKERYVGYVVCKALDIYIQKWQCFFHICNVQIHRENDSQIQ